MVDRPRLADGAADRTTVGYRGMVEERQQARHLRAQAWTLQEIADELGVAKSSVSLWVRDVAFDPDARRGAATGRRTFFEPDGSRLRVSLYLHVGLDLHDAVTHRSQITGVPTEQFAKPYRAVADPILRTSRHVRGCATVRYGCSYTHRRVMGLVRALTGAEAG